MNENLLTGINFQVDWGGGRIGFTEVSGLEAEIETIEYREGTSKEYTPIIIPGIKKYKNITLKRGIMLGDNDLFEWFDTVKPGEAEHRDITISLLNENYEPVVVWKVKDAFPVKLEGPILNASDSEIAIETLELSHTGFEIEHLSSADD